MLVAWALLVTERNHQAEVTDVVSQLVALNEDQLRQLQMKPLPINRAYKRFHDKWTKVRNAFADGFTFTSDDGDLVELNLDTWLPLAPRRAIPTDLPHSSTRAVDGTDWESAGRFRREAKPDYDGYAPVDTDTDPTEHAVHVEATRAATCTKGTWPVGPDGRAIHTTDQDARAGYRTTTAGRKGGPYIGSEIHLLVQVRDFTWQGDPSRVTEQSEVPNFISGAALSPAGTHRSKAVLPTIRREPSLKRVIWDRGYSILNFAEAHGALHELGIEPTFDLTTAQRDYQQVTHGMLWLDGHPFHLDTPKHLHQLERPPMGATNGARAEFQKSFDERAQWRWNRIGRPDADGYTRWQCPFHAGRLRARTIRQRKVNPSARMVTLPSRTKQCCDGTVTLAAEHLNLIQGSAIPYGTTAQAQAYGRRNLVETGNSYLGGTYITLERAYSRLMGHKNRKFVLGFLLAGLNAYIERGWRAREVPESSGPSVSDDAAGTQAPKKRVGRRRDTLTELRHPEEAPGRQRHTLNPAATRRRC